MTVFKLGLKPRGDRQQEIYDVLEHEIEKRKKIDKRKDYLTLKEILNLGEIKKLNIDTGTLRGLIYKMRRKGYLL